MIQYTSADRILSSLARELGDIPFMEDDMIEWIGEAMDFLKVYPILEERVAILSVKDYKAEIPQGLVHIIQLHLINSGCSAVLRSKDELKKHCDCKGNLSFRYETKEWIEYIKKDDTSIPILKATDQKILQNECNPSSGGLDAPEWTVIGSSDREFLFSFKEGDVSIAYSAFAVDENTGYPMIPDQPDFISAVGYYVKWKLCEAMTWRGREGYSNLLQYARQEWLRYAKQAKNWAKMPKTLDEYQSLMEVQYHLVPDLKMYYKGFAGLKFRRDG